MRALCQVSARNTKKNSKRERKGLSDSLEPEEAENGEKEMRKWRKIGQNRMMSWIIRRSSYN